MTALDAALRDMLDERAHDIDALPAAFLDLDSLDVLDREADARPLAPVLPMPTRRARARAPWLIAAAVAAVLAITGGILAVAHHDDHGHTTPPATRTPSVTPSPTRSADPRGPHTAVGLSWFGMAGVSGYRDAFRESKPGLRTLVLRKDGSDRGPRNSNGAGIQTAQIAVFDRGRYDPATTGILGGTRVTVPGAATAYRATTSRVLDADHAKGASPTIAWQYASDAWVVVQTLNGDGDPDLQRIADAVRPTQVVPITVPFRLASVPDLPITSIMDDRADGYAYVITLGTIGERTLDVALTRSRSLSGQFDTTDPDLTRRLVGGLPGYYAPRQGVAVPYRTGLLVLGISGTDSRGNSTITAADRRDLNALLTGLTWSGGDGSGPGVPLREAIPRT